MKDKEIKIRLSAQEKEIIKNAASVKGISMSELILELSLIEAQRITLNLEHKDIIENRIRETDNKLIEIKGNLENRRGYKKNKWWSKMK